MLPACVILNVFFASQVALMSLMSSSCRRRPGRRDCEAAPMIPTADIPPTAVIVTCLLFARPLIARLLEICRQPRRYPVMAGFSLERETGRREFPRVRLEDTPSGPMAVLVPNDSSGVLASMTASDGLVDLSAGLFRRGDQARNRKRIRPPNALISVTKPNITMIRANASRYSKRWKAVTSSSPMPPAPITPKTVAARRLCSQR